jgi:hypothetical protein
MSGRSLGGVFVLVVLAAVLTSVLETRAASFWEKNFWLSGPRYDAVVPLCEETWPLEKIQDRFSSRESNFWNSRLEIVSFEKVREVAFRPWVADAIPRRFCSAVAVVNDGVKRPVYYSIGEDTGMIGATWGVEWCVVGLDRNWAYNPACKMARP